MAGPAAITLVLVGTLRACIPTVGACCNMVDLAGPTAATGVRVITLTRSWTAARRAYHLEAVVRAAPRTTAGVLVVTLGACIPTVGARCDMVDLAGPTAATGVRVITLTRSWTAARLAYHLEAVVRAAPRTTAGVLVSTLVALHAALPICCNMVDLAGPTAATGVRVITLTRSWTAARRAYHLEAVV